MDPPPPKFTPTQVWNRVKTNPKLTESGAYWKDNILRHNLDVMHIEKKNLR